jgi:hypothetical protein
MSKKRQWRKRRSSEASTQQQAPKTPEHTQVNRTPGIILTVGITIAAVAALMLLNKPQASVVSLTKPNDNTPLKISKPKPKELTGTELERISNKQEWQQLLSELANDSKNALVKEVVEFFIANAITVIPHHQNARVLESAEGKPHWFSFTAITQQDANQGSFWKHLAEGSKAIAHFLPDQKLLLVKQDVASTKIWKQLVIAHETLHAKRMLEQPYDWTDEKTLCYKEVEAHELQIALIIELVPGYEALLTQEGERMIADGNTKGYKPGETYQMPTLDFYKNMHLLFGPPLSHMEKQFRESSTQIHAIFYLINKHPEITNKTDAKAKFLRQVYANQGLLPPPR